MSNLNIEALLKLGLTEDVVSLDLKEKELKAIQKRFAQMGWDFKDEGGLIKLLNMKTRKGYRTVLSEMFGKNAPKDPEITFDIFTLNVDLDMLDVQSVPNYKAWFENGKDKIKTKPLKTKIAFGNLIQYFLAGLGWRGFSKSANEYWLTITYQKVEEKVDFGTWIKVLATTPTSSEETSLSRFYRAGLTKMVWGNGFIKSMKNLPGIYRRNLPKMKELFPIDGYLVQNCPPTVSAAILVATMISDARSDKTVKFLKGLVRRMSNTVDFEEVMKMLRDEMWKEYRPMLITNGLYVEDKQPVNI
jgi:hypothetical protein